MGIKTELSELPNATRQSAIDRQQIVYEAVAAYWEKHGHAPGYNDLTSATGLCKSMLHYYLHKLRHFGLIAFEDGMRGTVRPTDNRGGNVDSL